MRSSFLHSLTFRLGLLVLISLAPAILVAVSLNRDFRKHLQEESLQDVQTHADRVAERGRVILAGGRQMIKGLALMPDIQSPPAHSISPVLRAIVSQSPDYPICNLFSATGQIAASSKQDAKPFSVADRPWFKDVVAGLACTQAEYVLGRSTGLPVMVLGCPVLDKSGRLVAVLSISVGFDWFHKQAAALDLQPNSFVCVVDGRGEVRAHFPQHSATDARYIPDSRTVMSKVRQGHTIHQELDQDGVRRTYAYSLLSGQPGRELYVRVGVPVADSLAPAEASAQHNALGLAAAVAFSLLAAALVAKTILAPTESMLKAVRSLGAGDLSARIHSRAKGELAEVANAVDAMAEALQRSNDDLRNSEQRLRQFMDESPTSYFVTSLEGRFLEANPAQLRMLGYDSLEQLQAEVPDVSRQLYTDPSLRTQLLEALRATGHTFQSEYEIYRRDGSTIWSSLNARALHNEAGEIIGVQGFSTDITHRRQMEMELKRSNERFLRVLENQADAIFVADAETDIVLYANKSVRDSLGQEFEGQELVGRPCWEVVRGGMAQCKRCPRQRLLDENGEPLGVHTREEHDEATGTWSLVRVQALRWVDGRLARLETITDITAIKRAQEELRTTSGHLHGILDTTPAVITIRDLEGRFLLASKRIEEIWGHPATEIHGKSTEDVYPPSIAAAARKEDKDIQNSGLPLTKISDIPLKDGHIVTLLITKFLLRDENGAPDKICTIATDMTERVRLERELHAAKEAAEQASRAKSDFLAKMSHEIRTPLNAVLGFSELAEMAASAGERNQALASLRESGRALLGLVNNILDVSRVESGSISLERTSFDPRQLVESAVEHLAMEAGRKGLQLSAKVGREVPALLCGDPARLRQILVNLAANAVKFTPQGRVDISLNTVGPDSPPRAKSPTGALMGGVQLLLCVKDTGIGIPEEVQHLVFENFTQADSSTSRKYGGTGLGLAICRQLARFMGGDIWLTSEPGEGSSFFVTLPFALAEAPTKQPPVKSLEPSRQGRPLHVLLAEDTPANTVIAQAFLRRLGHTNLHAANGQEALERLRQERFDLVLMDVEMPTMDGLEATRRLRAGEAGELNRFVPVLAMTAHALTSFRDKCAEAGMNGFVAKPVSYNDLAEILAKQGAGASRPDDAAIPKPVRADLVDIRSALDMLGGHREILSEVVGIFLAELAAKRQILAESLEVALKQNDAATLRLTAHSLKSSCASVGAWPASRAAENLEDAAKDGLTALLPGLHETLDGLLEDTGQALKATLQDLPL
ncbi:MAG: PAS domain S-box protein [Proteobacteria bacterium]|nr:PAS domain S-box protein [Pseudomonadota bacterium]